MEAGSLFGIRDPFVYKKAYPYVWFIQVDEVEILPARIMCCIDGAVFPGFLDSNQVKLLYPLIPEQTCHNLIL